MYLTPNGGCLHSTCGCRPMQSAGAAIQRSLCRLCFREDGLPTRHRGQDRSDRVVYFTKSGQYVHDQRTCQALAKREEVDYRKLCRCCRWR